MEITNYDSDQWMDFSRSCGPHMVFVKMEDALSFANKVAGSPLTDDEWQKATLPLSNLLLSWIMTEFDHTLFPMKSRAAMVGQIVHEFMQTIETNSEDVVSFLQDGSYGALGRMCWYSLDKQFGKNHSDWPPHEMDQDEEAEWAIKLAKVNNERALRAAGSIITLTDDGRIDGIEWL